MILIHIYIYMCVCANILESIQRIQDEKNVGV